MLTPFTKYAALSILAISLSACETTSTDTPKIQTSNIAETPSVGKTAVQATYKNIAILPLDIQIYEKTPDTKNIPDDFSLIVQKQLYA